MIQRMHNLHWLYLMLLLFKCSYNEAFNQLVSVSDQVVKEGDDEVVLSCNYSKVYSTLRIIRWDEVNEVGTILKRAIVSDKRAVNGRYSLKTTIGKADIVISKPGRNDSGRFFQCQMQTENGNYIFSQLPASLTVYYLDEPVVTASASIVYEGDTVNLTCCKLDGNPVPNSITWYKDAQALNITDTTKFTTSEDALEIHIKATTTADGGRYTCKAESDQYKREDGKISAPFDLTVIKCYIDNPVATASASILYEGEGYGKTSAPIEVRVIESYPSLVFDSETGTVTCIAESYPKKSYVMIFKDEKEMEKDICKSNITCFAENGEVNATEHSKSCNTGVSSSQPKILHVVPVVIVTAVTAITLGFALTCLICRYIHKRQEKRNRLQLTNEHQYQGMAYKRKGGKKEMTNADKSYCDVDNVYEQYLHF